MKNKKTIVNTIIVGAGHCGLAISYWLTKQKKDHIIFERGEIGERWKSSRWDSLTMVIPNSFTQLPGFHYSGPNPEGFDSKDEFVKFLQDYANSFNAPVKTKVKVEKIIRDSKGRYQVKTDKGVFIAKNVIIATGPFQKQKTSLFADDLPKNILQIPSTDYKNSSTVQGKTVLIVGSGNTGAQIAEELNRAGKKVYLSIGRFRKTPRRYRGRDIIYWFEKLGKLDQTTKGYPLLPIVFSGVNGGHEIDYRDLAQKGVTLIGHIEKVKNGKLEIASDLLENLEKGEEAYNTLKLQIDNFIEENKINAPKDEEKNENEKSEIEILNELDLKKAGITSVIWATGFQYDFDWIKIPNAFDEKGEPIHTRGASNIPGLFFLGLAWLHKYKSFFIYGVGEDAEYIASQIKE